jgi:ATP-dependent Clp protease ATP-binding subunit ClpC
VFERFTDRARRVVVLAQEEARSLDHPYIGTEHLLLGLIAQGEGVALHALRDLGVEPDQLRNDVVIAVGRGEGTPVGHVSFTPRAKQTLELALREALQLGHRYIGTEHLLLGLLREGEGTAVQVLQAAGVDPDRLRQAVVRRLSISGVESAVPPERTEPGAIAAGEYEASQAVNAPLASIVSSRDFPTCPACRATLSEWIRIRTLDAMEDDGDTPCSPRVLRPLRRRVAGAALAPS